MDNKLVMPVVLNVVLLVGCITLHDDFVRIQNKMIGQEMIYREPFLFENAGKLIRADFVLGGQGLTHITKNKDGDLVYHFSGQEILSNYSMKEWVGKCLIYEVVDPETYIIKSWGFDEGGNPLSCRSWP